MLGRFLDRLPEASLRWIVESRVSAWVRGYLMVEDRYGRPRGCLVGHASGYIQSQMAPPEIREVQNAAGEAGTKTVTAYWRDRGNYCGLRENVRGRFDRLCERFGRKRVVRAIQKRAFSVLSDRHEYAVDELLDSLEIQEREIARVSQ